eukprot:TRINITY_DN47137_c0_g1_i1.p1 TRINITY_DN47137_c0_g1~~TRINITY_DN47137_c0_g1_i1.p1  ORF type:complete len:264 (-),score=25.14 TRINITY_DN47137_c0_g1_i1:1167-1958(-)
MAAQQVMNFQSNCAQQFPLAAFEPYIKFSADQPTFVEEFNLPLGKKNISQEFPLGKKGNNNFSVDFPVGKQGNTFGAGKKNNSNKKRLVPKFIELQKTEMCHFLMDYGNCPYGDRCQYAHEESQLRSVTRHPKYKTSYCRQYQQQGMCPYGRRCQFIHEAHEAASAKLLDNTIKQSFQPSRAIDFANSKQPPSSQTVFIKKEAEVGVGEGLAQGDNTGVEVGGGVEVKEDGDFKTYNRLPVFVLLSQGIMPTPQGGSAQNTIL